MLTMTESTEKSILREYFLENGYVVIDTGLEQTVLDNVVASLSPYFGDNRVEPKGVTFSDYGRIQDAWYINNSVWKIANSKAVKNTLKILYGKQPKAFQTLNFYKGTRQATHADSIHFNSEPFGMMCGVWVALEDIGPNQGPLRLYPKSNKLQEMNYEDFSLKPSQSEYPKYLNEIERIIERNGFKESRAIIRKGQAVIWAANTLHGGSPQIDLSLTRHSQVTHYFMGEPKAWRPSFSENGREYFDPVNVCNIKGWGHRIHCYKLGIKELISKVVP